MKKKISTEMNLTNIFYTKQKCRDLCTHLSLKNRWHTYKTQLDKVIFLNLGLPEYLTFTGVPIVLILHSISLVIKKYIVIKRGDIQLNNIYYMKTIFERKNNF